MDSSPLKRALAQAPDRPQAEASRPDQEFFVFRAGELTLAVLSKHVRDVSRMGALTPLPRTPSFVLGVVGQRGQVVPVVDLLRFLQQGEGRVTARSRIFISDSGSYAVAFLADAVVGLRRIFVADTLPAPMGGTVSHEFLVGIAQSREFGALSLLDLPRIIASAHQRVSSR
ncbi:MAG: chemotaxis protein CheW [Archangium sp.]|nr:chemotaxis protein CheW [Archangium sp.]